jgi:hypothetical protein
MQISPPPDAPPPLALTLPLTKMLPFPDSISIVPPSALGLLLRASISLLTVMSPAAEMTSPPGSPSEPPSARTFRSSVRVPELPCVHVPSPQSELLAHWRA